MRFDLLQVQLFHIIKDVSKTVIKKLCIDKVFVLVASLGPIIL